MLITDLEAVNGVLRELGEQPLTSTDTSYPTVELAQTALKTARLELLQKGWWFNSAVNFSVTVSSDGKLALPDNVLEFIPDNPNYIWAGKYIMDKNGGATFTSDTVVKGSIKFDLTLQNMPYSAQEWIVLAAASKVYVADFGPDSKYQEIQLRIRELFNTLSAQHVRAKRPTMRNRPAVQQYYRSLFT